MKIQYIAILLLICWGSILKCSAQKVAVKTNLLYGAYSGTPNLGVEWGLSPRTTIELGAGLNWFTPNKASSNSLFADQTIPRAYLFGKDGKLIHASIGYTKAEFQELMADIEAALK